MLGSKCAVVGVICGVDKNEILVWVKGVLVATSTGVDESAMLVWSGSAKVDVMPSITSIFCCAWDKRSLQFITGSYMNMNPLVSSVSLTSESKLSCGQYLMKYWEKCNSVVRASLLSM